MGQNQKTFALLITAFVIATCGLIYELIAGTVASYLLGDSVTQFSTVIGVYLFSMGIGSYLSRFIENRIVQTFVRVELLVGVVGGCSAALLFSLFEYVEHFRVLLYGLVSLIGILVGLEIPLLMRILKDKLEFKELVSQVFTFDYIGALLASLLFPLVLVPHLGLVRSAFLFGLLNILVALWTISLFKEELKTLGNLRLLALFLLLCLGCGFAFSDRILTLAESSSYSDPVVYSSSSPYQRIVITGGKNMKLFLNGNLQFSAKDEYRYHEALVHPALGSLPSAKHVLILGGGDGLAAREVLKHSQVEHVTLVDLDSKLTDLFKTQTAFVDLNEGSLNDSRLEVVNADAFVWLRKHGKKSQSSQSSQNIQNYQYDFICVDFPDPSNFSLGKLYSDTFYRELKKVLAPDGLIVIQSTSPYYARNSFWCVVDTLESVGLSTLPYHAYVPSFGDWGYILAGRSGFDVNREGDSSFMALSGAGGDLDHQTGACLTSTSKAEINGMDKRDVRGKTRLLHRYPAGLRYVNAEVVENMLVFSPDMMPTARKINKLNNQALVHLFESEWSSHADSF